VKKGLQGSTFLGATDRPFTLEIAGFWLDSTLNWAIAAGLTHDAILATAALEGAGQLDTGSNEAQCGSLALPDLLQRSGQEFG
jgi:hypothetical protein